MKGLDLWEVLGCAEMCAGVPLALQTPDPTWRLQDGIGIAPRGVPGHGAVGLAPHPALRAHSFVSCAGLGTAGTCWCCPQPLQALGKDSSALRRDQLPAGVCCQCCGSCPGLRSSLSRERSPQLEFPVFLALLLLSSDLSVPVVSIPGAPEHRHSPTFLRPPGNSTDPKKTGTRHKKLPVQSFSTQNAGRAQNRANPKFPPRWHFKTDFSG